MNNQDRIDAYLHNEMTDSERISFEDDVRRDQTLADELALTEDIVAALAERQEMLDMMNEWHDEVAAELADAYSGSCANTMPSYASAELSEEDDMGGRAKFLGFKCLDDADDECSATEPIAESSKDHRRRTVWYWCAGVGLAVCLIYGIIISLPTVHTGFTPHIECKTAIASADSQLVAIDQLIKDGEYREALAEIDRAENDAAAVLAEVVALDSMTDEQALDKTNSEAKLYDLTWRRINMLLALNYRDKALVILNVYRTQSGEYQRDACELWRMLSLQN